MLYCVGEPTDSYKPHLFEAMDLKNKAITYPDSIFQKAIFIIIAQSKGRKFDKGIWVWLKSKQWGKRRHYDRRMLYYFLFPILSPFHFNQIYEISLEIVNLIQVPKLH